MVTPIEEGDKVKAEISSILYKDQIRFIKSEKQWPEGFDNQDKQAEEFAKLSLKEEDNSDSEEDSEEDDSDLFQNTNRPVYEASEEDSETETDSDAED